MARSLVVGLAVVAGIRPVCAVILRRRKHVSEPFISGRFVHTKPLCIVIDILYVMAQKTSEPTVRMTLRIPESLINRFESVTTHRDARSMNEAICKAIEEKTVRQERRKAAAVNENHD